MSTRYKILDPEGIYFVTMTVVGWIDLFTRKAHKDILIDSLRYCQKHKGSDYLRFCHHEQSFAYDDTGWCGKVPLPDILRDFKKFTSRQLNEAVQEVSESRREWMLHQFKFHARKNKRKHTYQIWQPDNHPFLVYSPKFIWEKLDYMHLNPVKAGLVRQPEHYVYSSASNYLDGTGILDVKIMEMWITEGYLHIGL